MKRCTNVRAIKQILFAIEKTVNCMKIQGFFVNVEITTENGVIYTVPFKECDDKIKITDCCLDTGCETISLSFISKIVINSSETCSPVFTARLTKEVCDIMKGMGGRGDSGEFAACMQKFINCNKLDIESVNYTGGMETEKKIYTVKDVDTAYVVGSAGLYTNGTTTVGSATLTTNNNTVVGRVTTSDTNVVTNVTGVKTSVATGVTSTTAQVSPPIKMTAKTVVTDVATNPQVNKIVTSVSSTPETINSCVSQSTGSAATGFNTFTNVEGVLGGITSATVSETMPYTSTPIKVGGTGAKTGLLQIVIPANAFGNNIPSKAKTFNVVVSGVSTSTVSLEEPCKVYGLEKNTTILTGINGKPTSIDLAIPDTLSTGQFVTKVTTKEKKVAGQVLSTTVPGTVVTDVTKGSVNNPVEADPVTVVKSVTATTGNVQEVGSVTNRKLSTLVNTTPKTVVGSASLKTTPANVLNNVTIKTTPKRVVQSIETRSVCVLSPANECIDGDIICAGNGVMTVENDNGNISLYNVCDINAVETKDRKCKDEKNSQDKKNSQDEQVSQEEKVGQEEKKDL